MKIERPSPPPRRFAARKQFFARPWIQWLILLAGTIAPSITFALKSGFAPSDTYVAITLAMSALFSYCIVNTFDPGSIPSPGNPSVLLGIVEKIMALGHAIGALVCAFHFFRDDMQSDMGDTPTDVKLAVLAFLWLMAFALFMAGDAQYRLAIRVESQADADGPACI